MATTIKDLSDEEAIADLVVDGAVLDYEGSTVTVVWDYGRGLHVDAPELATDERYVFEVDQYDYEPRLTDRQAALAAASAIADWFGQEPSS